MDNDNFNTYDDDYVGEGCFFNLIIIGIIITILCDVFGVI